MGLHQVVQKSRQSNRFFPPRIAPAQLVYRTDLLENELSRNAGWQYVFMEARAGQGKTTTALQYIQKIDGQSAWCQLGEEDRDPLFFLSSVIEAINYTLECSRLPPIQLRSGGFSQMDLCWAVEVLSSGVRMQEHFKITLVLDDLHIITDAPETLAVLDNILDSAPPNLSFLLLSRTPLPLKSKKLKFGDSTLYLTNDQLRFSLHETVDLFSRMEDVEAPPETVYDLHAATEGWVMGMILARTSVKRSMGVNRKKKSPDLYRFFYQVLLEKLPLNLLNDLLKLSLLEDIPLDLAVKITGNDNLGDTLEELMEKNLFVRLEDDEGEIFSFHHLMRDVLRQECIKRLDEQKRYSILKQAVDYSLAQGMVERAVVYVLRMGNISDIEILLEKHGLELVAGNRLDTLMRIAGKVEKSTLCSSAWIELFLGLTLADSKPDTGVFHLARAAELFAVQENKHGRLLAISQIVYHHILTASCLREGAVFLAEAEELYLDIQDSIPMFNEMFVCRNLGAGLVVFQGHLEKGRACLKQALKWAQELQIPNMVVSGWVFCGYSYVLAGNFPSAGRMAESIYRYLLKKEVGTSNKAFAHHFLTDLHEIRDDFLNYARCKAGYSVLLGNNYISQTQMKPSILLWDVKLLIARGELENALRCIEDAEYMGPLYNTAHIRSRVLEFKVLILALLQQDIDLIPAMVEESTALRDTTSWRGFFTARHHILMGAALGLTSSDRQADTWMGRGIDSAQKGGYVQLEAGGLMFRSYINLEHGKKDEAQRDLLKGLLVMKQHGLDTFWCWTPKIMLRLLSEAWSAGIEQTFVGKLVRKRFKAFIDKDGDLCPCLEIHILGNFQFLLHDKVIAITTDFSPMQRSFVLMVLASPGCQLSQEKAQTLLWPDVPKEKARRTLDTLISRLRSMLRPLLPKALFDSFLQVGKGMISMRYCLVDAFILDKLLQQGESHADNEEWWQAGNCFASAGELWKGCFGMDNLLDDSAYEYCRDLQGRYYKMVDQWSAFFIRSGQLREAHSILETAFKFDPTYENITAKLYRLHLLEREAVAAKSVLDKYRKGLAAQGLTAEEIEDLVAPIVQSFSRINQ